MSILALPSEGSKEVSSDRLFSALRYLFATQIGVLKIDLFVLYMVPVYAMFALFLQIVIFRWDPGVSFPAVLCRIPTLFCMLNVSSRSYFSSFRSSSASGVRGEVIHIHVTN